MTGMDVLRQCRRYSDDMAKLKLKRQIALDMATRITGSMSEGDGRGSGVSDRVGRYGQTVQATQLAEAARKSMYAAEMFCAGEMLAGLSVEAASVMYSRMIDGATARQTAANLHRSESSVRSLYARARTELEKKTASIGSNAEYRRLMSDYHANGGALAERFVKRLGANEPL